MLPRRCALASLVAVAAQLHAAHAAAGEARRPSGVCSRAPEPFQARPGSSLLQAGASRERLRHGVNAGGLIEAGGSGEGVMRRIDGARGGGGTEQLSTGGKDAGQAIKGRRCRKDAERLATASQSTTWFMALRMVGVALAWCAVALALIMAGDKLRESPKAALPRALKAPQLRSPEEDADAAAAAPVGPKRGPPLPEASAPGGALALFKEHARAQPGAAALLDAEGGGVVTYGALAGAASALAAALGQAALGDGDVVGLLLEPSCRFVVAALGAMQAGTAWLPLDLKSPGARLRHLLDRAGARLVLVAEGWPGAAVVPVPTWELGPAGQATAGSLRPPVRQQPLSAARALGAAAVFYTSGSSGEPKAVIYASETICHGAICVARLCGAEGSSVFLVKTPTVWAVSEYEVFSPLVSGASAVLDPRAQRDPARLARTIARHSVSVLVTSAPVLQLLTGEPLPSLRHVVSVGAGLPLEVCAAAQRAFGAGLSIHNLYGCTETPCLQWTYDVAGLPPGVAMAPAGLPQPGVEVVVLDGDMQPVRVGSLGEIFIGGPFLSHGYLCDEPLTSQRFLLSPLGKGQLYRTGDVGRWLQDAHGRLVLQVEGRQDRQLNLRGVRVAPEEVEAALAQAPGVREAALLAVGGGGAERLAACVAGEGRGLAEAVRSHVAQHLPPHMQPAGLLLLGALPRLPNGKVDLLALTKLATVELQGREQGVVLAIDSLGRMQLVKRRALREFQVMSAARALATIGLVLYHWYWAHFTGYPWTDSVKEDMRQGWEAQGPWWFRACIRGLVGILDWAMYTFMTLAGYMDSKDAHKSMFMQNVIALLLYIMCYWPLGTVVHWLRCVLLRNPHTTLLFSYGNQRWYLAYYVLCNVLHSWVFLPLRSTLAGGTGAQVLVPVWLMLGLMGLLHVFTGSDLLASPLNLCLGELREWQKVLLPWLVTDFDPDHYACPVVRPWHLWLFVIYSVACWWGPPLVEYLRTARVGRLFEHVGALPLVALLLVFATWLGHNFPDDGLPEREELVLQRLVNPLFTYMMLLALALAVQSWWFPLSGLAWLGNFSLATYMLHEYFVIGDDKAQSMSYFTFNSTVLIPTLEDAVLSVGAWPGSTAAKCAVLVAYPVVFIATLGALFQKLLLLGFALLPRPEPPVPAESPQEARGDSGQNTEEAVMEVRDLRDPSA